MIDDLIDTAIMPTNLLSSNHTIDAQIPDKLTDAGLDLNAVVRELEGKLINEALTQTGGNKQAAAEAARAEADHLRRQAAPVWRNRALLQWQRAGDSSE